MLCLCVCMQIRPIKKIKLKCNLQNHTTKYTKDKDLIGSSNKAASGKIMRRNSADAAFKETACSWTIDNYIATYLYQTCFLTQLCPFPADRGQSRTCTEECLKKWRISSSLVCMMPSYIS